MSILYQKRSIQASPMIPRASVDSVWLVPYTRFIDSHVLRVTAAWASIYMLDRVVNHHSPPSAKIALFRDLFRGRDDVYPRRFESRKTGKKGYQPACVNEWVRDLCDKRRVKCAECPRGIHLSPTGDAAGNRREIPFKCGAANPFRWVGPNGSRLAQCRCASSNRT